MNTYKFLLASLPIMLATPVSAYSMADSDENDNPIEEILVTGSHIKRSKKSASLPLSTYDRDDYTIAGSPSITDIIDASPFQSGSINRSDQFSYGGEVSGLKAINLRGLGLGRTLVLFNGKRMINAAATTTLGEMPVDIGNFPLIAMQKIEVLKNGGATAYGSDAIAGVWNYITRDDFVGLEVRASHTAMSGSDGDHEISAIWGMETDVINWVTSIEWTNKNRLAVPEINKVDYNTSADNGGWPLGNSGFGNPATFYATDFSLAIADPACGASVEHDFGPATSYVIPNSLGSGCGFSYMNFYNIIDPQSRLKLFSQVKTDISDNVEAYAEFMYASLKATYDTSPSGPPLNPAAGYFTFIPTDNPGFQDMLTGLSTAEQTAFSGGALWLGRPVAIAGPSVSGPRNHNTWRILTGVRGNLSFAESIRYDVSVSYGKSQIDVANPDVLTEKFDLAANGLGGETCARVSNDPNDPANTQLRGDTAQGCFFYNVSGSHLSAAEGSLLANSPELINWLFGVSSYAAETDLFVADATLSGDLPFSLKGGNIEWATGIQYRQWKTNFQPNGDNLLSADADSFDSPFHFQGVDFANITETKTWAIFTEASLPVTDTFMLDLGARWENYGQGDVIKPKVAGTYMLSDKVSFRASYEKSFRSPVLGNEQTQTLTYYDPIGEYIPVATPVPENIDPEQATNWSAGAAINLIKGLTASIDYYSIKLSGPISIESSTCDCADKITDNSGTVISIVTEMINGEPLTTSGIDFALDYQFSANSVDYNIGFNGNWVAKYDIEGNTQTGGTYHAAGKYNFRSVASPVIVRSIPTFKMNGYVGVSKGEHSVSTVLNYVSGYDIDETSTMFGIAGIETIRSHMTADLNYRYALMKETELSLSIKNITDRKVPLAPHEYGYDAGVHNPIGRIWRVAIQHSF